MAPLTSVDTTLALILGRSAALPAEDVQIADAAGRVLAEDVAARVNLPGFPSSAMDGFALCAADAPGTLRVVARIAAGRPTDRPLRDGEAMGIATGGTVPAGADAVIPLEVVEDLGDRVVVPAIARGANVRPVGGDLARGDLVGCAGTVVGPARLAALAAAGSATVRCGRRPRVAILTTGTELREPGAELGPGEIYESNSPMLAALFRGAGAEVIRLRSVADDPDVHRTALAQALEADVVVTTGGVSVGPHDLVRPTLAGLGVEEIMWGVAMRPGKPFAFGARGATLVFGLPGNPVSSFVGAVIFVVPALLALQGATAPGPHYLRGTLAAEVRPRAALDEYVRATLAPDGSLAPLPGQESHMIAAAAEAGALVRIRPGAELLRPGTAVDYLRLDALAIGA